MFILLFNKGICCFTSSPTLLEQQQFWEQRKSLGLQGAEFGALQFPGPRVCCFMGDHVLFSQQMKGFCCQHFEKHPEQTKPEWDSGSAFGISWGFLGQATTGKIPQFFPLGKPTKWAGRGRTLQINSQVVGPGLFRDASMDHLTS